MNGWLAAVGISALAAVDRWHLYKLLRDGKLRTAPAPRKPPLAIEPPK